MGKSSTWPIWVTIKNDGNTLSVFDKSLKEGPDGEMDLKISLGVKNEF